MALPRAIANGTASTRAADRIVRAGAYMGISGGFRGFVRHVRQLCGKLAIPRRLSRLGVTEDVIDSLAGVDESAVVGVPHADFGEGVVAVVVPERGAAPEEAAIIAACREKLAAFKVPKKVFFQQELPRNTMGKVQKNALRRTYEATFEKG